MAKKRSASAPGKRRNPRRGPRFEDTGHEQNYCNIAVEFAETAAKDTKGKKFGALLRLGAIRFLEDLKRARRRGNPFTFEPWYANDACDFIEKLPHVEGTWPKPTIELHPAHVFFIVQLFGFRGQDGYRRFTSALFAVARKNAKSTIAAAILLYCECCENEEGAQVISAATTFTQASIIFSIAKRMVQKTLALREHFALECFAKSVVRHETGASFKPIHAKGSTQDGLNPSHTGLDEIHAHKTADLLNVLTSAAGARRCPLWLYTTTEGYANPGPWAEIRQFAKQILDGVFGESADHFLAVFFAVDDEDDEFDERAWAKANPLMSCNPYLLRDIRKEATEAKAMPSKMAEFRIKRLNRPASTASGAIDLLKWKACGGEVDLEWLAQFPCTGALDLASNRDLNSWRLVWKVDGIYYTWGRRWVPEDAVHQRTVRGTVNYAGWVEAGWLEQTEGDVTDHEVVEQAIRDDHDLFNILNIAYDSWNAMDLVNRLTKDDLPMIEFVQGSKSYHPAYSEFERAYVSGKLRHGGDEVLTWCASNLVLKYGQNLQVSLDKKRSADKIDDIATLIMAIGLHVSPEEETPTSVYEERGVRTL